MSAGAASHRSLLDKHSQVTQLVKPGDRIPPELQLASKPQTTIALWPVPNYTGWRPMHVCVCEHLLRIVTR